MIHLKRPADTHFILFIYLHAEKDSYNMYNKIHI